MSYMTQIRDIVALDAARRAAIDGVLSPSAAFSEAFKVAQTPHHRILTQMATIMQREQRLYADLMRPHAGYDEVAKQLSKNSATMDIITAPCRAVQEAMSSQSIAMQAVATKLASVDTRQLSGTQFSQPALAWSIASSGLAGRMQESGLLEQRHSLAARLLEAPRVYASFVEQTTDRIVAAETPHVVTLLRRSMLLVEDQLLGIAGILDEVLVVPDDTEVPDLPRELNAPYIQQDEILSLAGTGDDTDVAAIARLVPSARVVNLSRRLLERVTECNEAAKTSRLRVEIFKPTTRLLAVYADLPWIIPTNKSMFLSFVDCLYFLFYEAAGKDCLRFLDTYGGPLTAVECDLIWCIKHLRNKWSRHDADHGSNSDIRKSWDELTIKFRWLGLAQFPSSPEHFQELHRKLLELAIDFLEAILRKLRLG
ncbi:MAG: hypothetical protein NT171_07790 [Planctomycetota bacterium]|nr:hypothetical protein [Planctomycetota bacterium]